VSSMDRGGLKTKSIRRASVETRRRGLDNFFSRRFPALGGIHALPPGIRYSFTGERKYM
jgi:hypothetical protein